MWWITRIFAKRWQQPPLIRWLEAVALFGTALATRFALGSFYEAARFLTFYPVIIVAAVMLGLKEAILVLVLSLLAGWYFFLPPGLSLLPLGWAIVAILSITIIVALKALAEQLLDANERQRVLFEELQHRVANTLQITVGTLERIRRKLNSSPDECAIILDEAVRRMSASAEMHRRLHNPRYFRDGLGVMLREIVTTLIDQPSVTVDLQVEEIDLSLDQKSVLAMLVMEVATNSAKHVFQQNLGSRFEVVLRALEGHSGTMSIRDDGPGFIDICDRAPSSPQLGMRILEGLTNQLHGTLFSELDGGRKVTITFPTSTWKEKRRYGVMANHAKSRRSGRSRCQKHINRSGLFHWMRVSGGSLPLLLAGHGEPVDDRQDRSQAPR